MFSTLKTDAEKFSYCLGLDVAMRVKSLKFDFNAEAFLDAVNTIVKDGKTDISQKDYDDTMKKLFEILEKAKQEATARHSTAKADGDKFREENAKKPGVTTTASGLQIEFLQEGNGPMPKATDKVKVHYEGTLINGKVFDSSYKRNEPIVFPLDQVIPGWTEGLQMAKVGSKIRLVIPSELAYGSRGAGADIPPHSTLVFIVELLDIVK